MKRKPSNVAEVIATHPIFQPMNKLEFARRICEVAGVLHSKINVGQYLTGGGLTPTQSGEARDQIHKLRHLLNELETELNRR